MLKQSSILKSQAEAIFTHLGLTSQEALNHFYLKVIETKSIPFEIENTPNTLTKKTIDDARKGQNLTSHKTSSDFFKSFK